VVGDPQRSTGDEMGKPFGDADSIFRLVRHFHAVAGVPISDIPSQLEPSRLLARVEWLREEVAELESATTLVDQVDALVDVIYVALGALVEMGVELDEPFRLVHESNLAKAWPDGSFQKTGEGKIIKPNAWQSPRKALSDLLGPPTRREPPEAT
jgi:predicted HAD superfamily Cof-like phosphohydrolase